MITKFVSKIYLSRNMIKNHISNKFVQFSQRTGLHGYKYIGRKSVSFSERLFWIIIIVGSIINASIMTKMSFLENTQFETSTMIENFQYPVSYVPFPAVTICNVNLISKEKALKLIETMNLPEGISSENLLIKFRALVNLITFQDTLEDSDLELQQIMDFNNMTAYKVLQQLAPGLEQFMIECSWKGTPTNCSTMFRPVWTSEGICYSFNYYGKSINRGSDWKIPKNPLKVSGCGSLSALTVKLDPRIDDYWATRWPVIGVQVKVHEPRSVVDENVETRIIEAGGHINVNVLPETVYATDDVMDLTPNKRQCYLSYEGMEDRSFFNATVYSYQNCLAACRNRVAFEKCGCIPYHYFRLEGPKRTCNLYDVSCLNRYRDLIVSVHSDSQNHTCNTITLPKCGCKPDCEFVDYPVETSSSELKGNNSINEADFITSSNDDDKIIVHVAYRVLTAMRYRLQVFVGWKQMLVSFAGILSLCLGFSVLAVFEIFYFFSLRLVLDRFTAKIKTQPAPAEASVSNIELIDLRVSRSSYQTKFIRVASISERMDRRRSRFDQHYEYCD